jgi:serine/threonine-protein kinase
MVAAPPPGTVIGGRYRVDHVLGHGGMGVVVAATHLELHQRVAIKVLLPTTAKSAEANTRFLREGRAAARLTSPYAAKVFDNGRLPSGEPYLVMELLSGRDLRTHLASVRRVPLALAVEWVLQAAHALGEAHRLHVIHRDVKPANLFLTETSAGSVIKVVDFGVSKQVDDRDSDLTNTATVLGTPRYMAPEQMRSARLADERCDVWSLGVVLYELTTGESPFRGDTVTALCFDVMERTPVPPSHHDPTLPPAFDACVARCLAKDPDDRYPSMDALTAALRPFAAPELASSLLAPGAASPSPATPPASRPSTTPPATILPRVLLASTHHVELPVRSRRSRHVLAALGGGVGLVVVAVAAFMLTRSDAQPTAEVDRRAGSLPSSPAELIVAPSSAPEVDQTRREDSEPKVPLEPSVIAPTRSSSTGSAVSSAPVPPQRSTRAGAGLCDPPRWKDKNGHWVPKPYCL